MSSDDTEIEMNTRAEAREMVNTLLKNRNQEKRGKTMLSPQSSVHQVNRPPMCSFSPPIFMKTAFLICTEKLQETRQQLTNARQRKPKLMPPMPPLTSMQNKLSVIKKTNLNKDCAPGWLGKVDQVAKKFENRIDIGPPPSPLATSRHDLNNIDNLLPTYKKRSSATLPAIPPKPIVSCYAKENDGTSEICVKDLIKYYDNFYAVQNTTKSKSLSSC